MPIMMKLRAQFYKLWTYRNLRTMCIPAALSLAAVMGSLVSTASYAEPTWPEELEEYEVEELAFIASLQLYVIESLDPACQKMQSEKRALEMRDYRLENGEKASAELTALSRAWSANCRRKADAAKDSYPPQGRVIAQSLAGSLVGSLFGSSPRCMMWARSVLARAELSKQPTEEEMASEISRECRCVGPDSNKADSNKSNSDQRCPSAGTAGAMAKQTPAAGVSARLSEGLKKIEVLKKSVRALELQRDTDYDGLEARRDAALGSRCSSLFKIAVLQIDKGLSSDAIRASINEYKQLDCKAKEEKFRSRLRESEMANQQQQSEMREQITKLRHALPKASVRTPECRKLVGQLLKTDLKPTGFGSVFEVAHMLHVVSEMMEEQQCDTKMLHEISASNQARQEAEAERLNKNPCELKKRLQDALKLRQAGAMTELNKHEMAQIEKMIADVVKKCP
jgi:hypothetical protein